MKNPGGAYVVPISDTLGYMAERLKIDLAAIADSAIRERLLRQPALAMTARMQRALLAAQSEGQQHGHSYIGTEHVVLGILMDPASIPAQILEDMGVRSRVIAQLRDVLRSGQQAQDERGQGQG